MASGGDDPYVIMHDSNTITTSNIDIERALTIKGRYGSRFLWTRFEGRGYVIRDAATLAAIDALFEPSRALGPEQERLRTKMRPLEKREERLDGEADAISDGEDRTARDEYRLRDLRRELRDVERELRVLERQEEELDRKQERLDREAERAMKPIIREAIRKGTARPE